MELTVVTKSRSCGCSWNTVPDVELTTQYLHLVVYCQSLGTIYDGPVILGWSYPVKFNKTIMGQDDKPFDVFISGKRLADVVDLKAPVFLVGIGKEENLFDGGDVGSKINQLSIGVLPEAMVLGFDQYFWPNPDYPAVVLYAAVHSQVLWNDTETIKDWLSGQRLTQNPYRITTADTATE